MKNRKMSTTITMTIFMVITICISLLYIIANKRMTTIMKKSEMEALRNSLNVETSIIEEYIYHQEDLLVAFSNESEVVEFLKDPDNEEKRVIAQKHTEEYYSRLKNWEGLYIGEWNTHVIAHSNETIVGMVTREGESLKELQDAMMSRNGLYNAGIIVSPASQKLILSLYCPVYDYDGETIIGYVGGGPFTEELERLLASAEKQTATYYMINVSTGMYLFAQDDALMATQIKDKMLLSIVDMLAGKDCQCNGNIGYYDDKNGDSIAVYQYMPEYGWALVSCNSEKNIYADIYKNMLTLGVICVLTIVIIVILSLVVIRISTRLLTHIEKAIVQLEAMNLEKDSMLEKYINGKSEIGQIATAIDSLYDSIESMLTAEKEKQIAEAKSESKAKFLASMSHEIRTPMNAIIGMNEMILRENKDEKIHEYSSNIKSSSTLLLGIVNDILDFSKIEAGKLQIVRAEYKTKSMLKDAILSIEASVKQKKLDLNLKIDENIPRLLKGDEIRIKQILNNLLSNAVKYTDKGSITFTATSKKRNNKLYLIMSVIDTGMGIREEDLDKLFDSFNRLDLAQNRYKQGTGLGLNITKQLTDIMEGELTVESKYGKGSCFTVEIPQDIIDDAPMGVIDKADNNDKIDKDIKKVVYLNSPKILAVDDNSVNLKVLEAYLSNTGIEVDLAESGKECLKYTKQKKYDLILMDHMMPELDGIETFNLIRQDTDNLNCDTNVIMLTANAIAGAEEEYLQNGFVGYLTKPLIIEKLFDMLNTFFVQEHNL